TLGPDHERLCELRVDSAHRGAGGKGLRIYTRDVKSEVLARMNRGRRRHQYRLPVADYLHDYVAVLQLELHWAVRQHLESVGGTGEGAIGVDSSDGDLVRSQRQPGWQQEVDLAVARVQKRYRITVLQVHRAIPKRRRIVYRRGRCRLALEKAPQGHQFQ